MGLGRVAEKRAVWRSGGGAGQDGLDVIDETHRKHFVGFVEHHGLDTAQVEAVAFEQVEHAAGGADHHIHALVEAVDLRAVGLPAVDGQDAHVAKLAVLAEGLRDLQGQFTRGAHHQRLDMFLAGVEVVQNGQGEGGGLAGAGLGLADHIRAAQHERDDGGLDGGGLEIAKLGDGPHQFGAQVKGDKFFGHQNSCVAMCHHRSDSKTSPACSRRSRPVRLNISR